MRCRWSVTRNLVMHQYNISTRLMFVCVWDTLNDTLLPFISTLHMYSMWHIIIYVSTARINLMQLNVDDSWA